MFALCVAARRVSARQPSSFWLDPKGTKRSSPHCARPSPSARGSRVCGQGRGRAETPCIRSAHSGQTVCPGQFTRPALRAPLPWPQTRRRRGAAAKPSYPLAVCTPPLEVRYSAVGCSGVAPFAPQALAPRQGRAPQARHPSSSARLFDRSEQRERREFLAGPCLGARAGYSLATPRSERIRGLIFWFLLDQAKRNSAAGTKSRRAATSQHPS
jgi:hypothetical protein